MKNILKLLFMSSLLAFTACSGEDDPEPFDTTKYGVIPEGNRIVTGDVDSISYTSVACYGVVNTALIDGESVGGSGIYYGRIDLLTKSELSDLESKSFVSESNVKSKLADVVHKDKTLFYSRTVLTDGIYAGTEYFYYNSSWGFQGEIKRFTTKGYDLNIKAGEVSDVDYTSLKVSGGTFNNSIMKSLGVEYTYGVAYISEIEYDEYKAQGLSDTNIFETKSTQLPSEDLANDVATVTITELRPNTTYYYSTYVKAGRTYVDDIKKFSTKTLFELNTISGDVVISSAIKVKSSIKSSEVKQTDDYSYGVVYVSDKDYQSAGKVISKCKSAKYVPYSGFEMASVEETIDKTFDITLQRLNGETKYHYCTYIKYEDCYYYGNVLETTTPARSENDLRVPGEAIDLGLSVLWSDRNLGAGGYYDITPQFHRGGLTPYYSNNKDEVRANDWLTTQFEEESELNKYEDAASVYWGDGWRMPTYEECVELVENCKLYREVFDKLWCTHLVGPSGKKIIVGVNKYEDKSNNWVYYWTGTSNESENKNIGFNSTREDELYYFFSSGSGYALFIRPVKDKK